MLFTVVLVANPWLSDNGGVVGDRVGGLLPRIEGEWLGATVIVGMTVGSMVVLRAARRVAVAVMSRFSAVVRMGNIIATVTIKAINNKKGPLQIKLP